MKSGMPVPRLYTGDIVIDDRGEVGFVNEFDFSGVKRFYTVTNHRGGFVRAWHAHQYEAKYVVAMQGAALVGVAEIDDWKSPSKSAKVWRYVLSATKPAVLYIPPGYANGFMSLTQDTKLVFFSTATLEESKDDDVRFSPHYWDIWAVEER